MPIYEFKCDNCGAEFERLCAVNEGRDVRCPECDSDDCRRLVSLVARPGAKAEASASCSIKRG